MIQKRTCTTSSSAKQGIIFKQFPVHGNEYGRSTRPQKEAGSRGRPGSLDFRLSDFPIDIPRISPYDNDADEFVRHNCRDRTGWRRDEWAYSPLFICGKFLDFWGDFPRFWREMGQSPLGSPSTRLTVKRQGNGVPGERFLLAGV
jgi:hypothetical protein